MEKLRKLLRNRALLTCGVTLSLLVVGWLFQSWRAGWLVSVWQQELAVVADDQAESLLRQAAQTGDEAIPLLAAALGSTRSSVAAAADVVLHEQIRDWDQLGMEASTPKLALLAAALAEHCNQYDPSARRSAGRLATIALRWPVDPELIDRGQMVADCEWVIRAAAEIGQVAPPAQQAETDYGNRAPAGVLPVFDPSREAGQGESFGNPLAPSHRLPGGGIPIPSISAAGNDDTPLDAPRPNGLLIPWSSAHGETTNAHGRLGPDLASPLSAIQNDTTPATDRTLPMADRQSTPTQSGEVSNPHNPLQLRTARPDALFALLRSPQTSVANSVRLELTRRGFSQQQIDLAWQLTDPDPIQRQRWIERLSSLRGIDSTPWLLWMARDEDASVRLAAVTMLATSTDPNTLRRVEAIATEDTDTRVRRVAERIARATSNRRQ